MLLGGLQSTLFYMLQDGGCQKFDRISYPPLILAFCSSVQRYAPLHIYPCICSVAPCLRVLWMSTHGCLVSPFPHFSTRLLRPDDGAQDPDATFDDDSYYTGGAYYYVQPADDDQE